MAKTLAGNVYVGGAWYGPSYPQNAVTDEVLEQVTNPAAFDPDAQGSHPGLDLRFRADDFASSRPAVSYEPDGGYDDDASVAKVLGWVDDDPSRARQALTRENDRAAGPRTSLVSALEKIAGA